MIFSTFEGRFNFQGLLKKKPLNSRTFQACANPALPEIVVRNFLVALMGFWEKNNFFFFTSSVSFSWDVTQTFGTGPRWVGGTRGGPTIWLLWGECVGEVCTGGLWSRAPTGPRCRWCCCCIYNMYCCRILGSICNLLGSILGTYQPIKQHKLRYDSHRKTDNMFLLFISLYVRETPKQVLLQT